MYIAVLPACTSVSDLLEQELETVVSCSVGTEPRLLEE